jgi:hypothetical protein
MGCCQSRCLPCYRITRRIRTRNALKENNNHCHYDSHCHRNDFNACNSRCQHFGHFHRNNFSYSPQLPSCCHTQQCNTRCSPFQSPWSSCHYKPFCYPKFESNYCFNQMPFCAGGGGGCYGHHRYQSFCGPNYHGSHSYCDCY